MKKQKDYTLLAIYIIYALIISGAVCDYDNHYLSHLPGDPNAFKGILGLGAYNNPEKLPYRTEPSTFVKDDVLYSWTGRKRDGTVLEQFDGLRINPVTGELEAIPVNFYNNFIEYLAPQYYNLGAAAVVLPNTDTVLFFGGIRTWANGTIYTPQDNDMYVLQYDFVEEEFSIRNITNVNGTAPRNTKAPTATLAPNGKIYVFGGIYTSPTEAEQDLARFGDFPIVSWEMSVFDPETNSFSPIEVPPRTGKALAGISTALPDGRIVYFQNTKGPTDDQAEYLVAIFDTSNNNTTVINLGQRETTKQYYKEYQFGFLGPDQSTIYYYGGVYNYKSRVKAHNTFGALDTTTWTWSNPKVNVTNEVPRRRYEFVAGFLNNTYLLVGLGRSEYQWFTQFDLLRFSNDTDFNSTTYAWIPNIAYVDAPVDTSSGLSGGVIAGIVIGSIAFAIVAFVLWRYFGNVKATCIGIYQGLIFAPRTGEPLWAELSHTIMKLVLISLFIAYMAYNIVLVLESPIASTTMTKRVEDVEFPDVRICTKPFVTPPIYFTQTEGLLVTEIQSDKITQEEFLEYTQVEEVRSAYHHYPYTMTSATGETECWLFTTPSGFRIDNKDGGNKGIRFFFGGQLLKEPNRTSDARIQIELYAPKRNPNMFIFYSDFKNQTLTQEEIERYREGDVVDAYSPNKYTVDYNAHTTIGYQITKHRSLTSNGWNTMGFLQEYNDINELSTSLQPVDGDPELVNTIDIYPLAMLEITTQEQNVHTFLNVLGTVGGLYSLLVAADSLLFGTRPKSPWGIIQRISIFGSQRSLHNNLYNAFGYLDRPIPFINPVHKRFEESGTHQQELKDLQNSALESKNEDTSSSSMDTVQKKSIEDELSHRTEKTEKEVQDLQRRLQLMEFVFKAYYINEEIFQNLDEAHTKIVNDKSLDEESRVTTDLRRRKSDNSTKLSTSSDHELMLIPKTHDT